jgi:hypothetical protein
MTKREAYKTFTVECIDDFYDTLTLGKLYQVGIYNIIEQGSPEESYIVENDLGYTECFYSDSFKRINKAEERDIKLKELLGI